MKKRILIICVGLLLICAACTPQPPSRRDFLAMDTLMQLTAYGENAATALAAVEQAARELEIAISVTDENSEIARANNGEAVALSTQTYNLLEAALALCARTGGLLDVTLYPVASAWGFTKEAYAVPDAEMLAALMTLVDYTQVSLGAELALPSGRMLDLGAVAKGYLGDYAADILRANGVSSAILDFGGDICAVGAKPDGSPWRVSFPDPANPNVFLGVVSLADEAIVTSGSYERYFEQNGVAYGHIIDPRTAAPARSGLLSVTVIGRNGVLCDGLSTALFVMGAEDALAHARMYDDFDCVLVTEKREVIITKRLESRFTLLNTTDYKLVVAE